VNSGAPAHRTVTTIEADEGVVSSDFMGEKQRERGGEEEGVLLILWIVLCFLTQKIRRGNSLVCLVASSASMVVTVLCATGK
jgi:hypothetical protein